MQVAQGGVYSYYEVILPRAERMTDEEWISRLASANAPDLPPWASEFVLDGGEPVEALGFHMGSAYAITEEGEGLNFRETPGMEGEVLKQLGVWEYIQVIGGPVETDGYTWWEFNICGTEVNGWVVEEPDWYARDWK